MAAAAALMMVAAGAGRAEAAPHAGAVAPSAGSAAVRQVDRITLVTGDVVRLSTLADGRQAVTVDSGAAFELSERGGDVYAIPTEAVPLVRSGRVDSALFNLTDLVAGGYHDAARDTIPLLVSGDRAAPLAATAGATKRRDLRSIGAVAVTEDKARAAALWSSLVDGPATLASGVRRVWLDRKLRATLADSVPRIGAPAAWRAGYDGKGVKVAVLDSGYDATHPALKNRVVAEANFTDEADTVDRTGHGTHLAATIAGRGKGGAGLPGTGVAPKADLLVGKVLNSSGSGDLSWVIAGMEWAVGQGARIVNLSMGAEAFEGPDAASEAVDALSASSGALFVVAAGNSGPSAQTVTTPGTASSALTVGAVSKSDALATFSGRGPRLGDGAVKPEVTAPGVAIVAARAAGTTLGEPIDKAYTSMSGTSMAAPHVAGAAALLAQRHPDWKAPQLKAALVASAEPVKGAEVWEQGAGRVDVAAAIDRDVRVEPAAIELGKVPAGEPAPRATVTYHNDGARAVTLNLAFGKTQAVRITPARLTVPAHGSATATVHIDRSAAPDGMYNGVLTARGGGEELRTPLGANLVPPTHTLTVRGIAHDGGAPGLLSNVRLWNLDTGEVGYLHFTGDGDTVSGEVPAGRYALNGRIYGVDEEGNTDEVTAVSEPELVLSGDRRLTYDGRKAAKLTVDTPRPATLNGFGLVWQRGAGPRSDVDGSTFGAAASRNVYALPSTAPKTGTFQLVTRWDLAAPPLTAAVTGAGGFPLTEPRPVEGAPALDGRRTLPLVDGGDGTPDDLSGSRGAAVLIRWTGVDAVGEQLSAAGEAGAAVVLLTADRDDFPAYGGGSAVPAYKLARQDGIRLRERLASGAVTLDLTGLAESPYRYDLLLTERDRVPADLHYAAAELQLATVDTEYRGHLPQLRARDSRLGFVDGIDVGLGLSRAISRPGVRTDYVSTRDSVAWRHQVTQETTFGLGGSLGTMNDLGRVYRAGERSRETWFGPIVRPAMPDTTADYAYGAPANRWHDVIRVAMPQYADGAVSQYGWLDYRSDAGKLTLTRGGKVLGETTRPYYWFTVPSGDGRYKLTLDVARDRFTEGREWWTTSTATSTTWTFDSSQPKGDKVSVLPLLQVGYDIDAALDNTVPAGRPYPLRLNLGYQPGYQRAGKIVVVVRVSYDDGAHWRTAPTTGGRQVTATIPAAPAGARFATVRVTATDTAGNRIDQTITRAWKVS
ncbi:S8 family serine peptidase [Phytohabitans sp. LJ34]|uniref:S8 family serine peptidase n=1 Tax=Phytohabitans sp. LJ34 TaxID=3452217 RepID=UPI003F8AD18E